MINSLKQNLKIRKIKAVSFEGIRGMVEAGLGIAVLRLALLNLFKIFEIKNNIDENWAEDQLKLQLKMMIVLVKQERYYSIT